MIENTFIHLPGVGRVLERRLWKAGFRTWDDLWTPLHAGKSLQGILSKSLQLELFSRNDDGPTDPRAICWLDCLDQSRNALRTSDYQYFLGLLKPSDHWRLLGAKMREALFLDIETTGLSVDLHYITIVGALYEGKFYQWAWPEPLTELATLVHSAPLVVTFNGQRFDIPFLRAKTSLIPMPRAHIDLLYTARAAGFKGGQKVLEEELGLRRDRDIRAIDGAEAVTCWCRGLYGDPQSYTQLLRYNRADVEMMPRIAQQLCDRLGRATFLTPPASSIRLPDKIRCKRKALPYKSLQIAWREKRPSLRLFNDKLERRLGHQPTIVGIDLRSKATNPTGLATCTGAHTETCILYGDDEILEYTLAAKPDLVSIDAPLFLPRGRKCVTDDSPCRKKGGIVRDAERILWARGIRVYPALIRQMQGLTQRGIDLTRRLEERGIEVIESYPGAAQDILNIPRKKTDESLLRRGLLQFGYHIRGRKTHDELDAVTSALVGTFYLADQYEAIGADDEGYMIIPRSSIAWPGACIGSCGHRRTAFLVGLPGAGKTTLSRALAQRLGWRCFVLGDALRDAAAKDTSLRNMLAEGNLAPESIVKELISHAAMVGDEPGLLIDGFPRHTEQLSLANELFADWSVICLDVTPSVATSRLLRRLVCSRCGEVRQSDVVAYCPKCGSDKWDVRLEDNRHAIHRRVCESKRHLGRLLKAIEEPRIIHLDASQPLEQLNNVAVRQLMLTRYLKKNSWRAVTMNERVH
jgi:uncharacterized protein YprB with RNaseH-like and TPR domain/predicted nuclease with RNAse H fold/adenylate kinase family enzyme